jgi:hypothetical protein
LSLYDYAHAFVAAISGSRFNLFSQAVSGNLSFCPVSGRHADDLGQGLLELDKFDVCAHSHRGIVTAPHDGDASLDSRIWKPGLGVALHYGNQLKILENPCLKVKSIFHVKPRGRSEKSKIAIGLKQACDSGPEVNMEITSAANVKARPCGL